MTDCCTGFGFHTQANVLTWLWPMDRVGIYFHFLPGDGDKRLVVTPNSKIARYLVRTASDPFERGIALHSFQDTFSHEGFVGLNSKENDCFSWDNTPAALLPNYGHFDMRRLPDMLDATWTDSRIGRVVQNTLRGDVCVRETAKWFGTKVTRHADTLVEPVYERNYDKRKRMWAQIAKLPDIRFSQIEGEFWKKYKHHFIRAARRQRDFVKANM